MERLIMQFILPIDKKRKEEKNAYNKAYFKKRYNNPAYREWHIEYHKQNYVKKQL